jgi:hypothetical protein
VSLEHDNSANDFGRSENASSAGVQSHFCFSSHLLGSDFADVDIQTVLIDVPHGDPYQDHFIPQDFFRKLKRPPKV